ncbi:MAG: PAS domain-containing sensor histidine kinase [Parcubacteria group bacterium]|nr:PAS domain-containing sensor histidine kinase [Parcubacteria group bacterium]
MIFGCQTFTRRKFREVLEAQITHKCMAIQEEKLILPGDAAEWRELFENANELIQSVDENGRFLYVNKKWQSVLGYSAEEANGMTFPDIIHQDHLQACFEAFGEMRKGKSFSGLKTQFVAKSGGIIDVEGNISVRMKDGKFISTWGMFREVVPCSEIEKVLREEQKFSQAVIDSLPSVFYAFDVSSFRMVRWNRALVGIFGYSNEETAKMSPIDFIDEPDQERVQKAIAEAVSKGKVMMETNIRTKNGNKIPYFFSAVYSVIADKGYIVGMGIDITDLRKREQELDRVAKTLVRRDFELLQTNDILRIRDEQIAKEQELNRAKSEFVSLASHQLKTPLTVIKWYIEMIHAGYADKSPDKQKEYLGKIYSNTRRMVELIDAFLNVSRLELGVFSVKNEPVNLREKMDMILRDLAPKIKEKNLKLSKSYSPKESKLPTPVAEQSSLRGTAGQAKSNFLLSTDPKMIQIIFDNLISNAVKYTPPDGEIQVKMQKKGNEILISVVDSGIGIPEDQQSKIFTKFFRADNVAGEKVHPELVERVDGTGLGLYLVKSMVEKIGGKIWFRSPIRPFEAPQDKQAQGKPAAASKKSGTRGKEERRGTAFYIAFYSH